MTQWNIYFKIKGPGGEVEAPSNTNPVEAESISSLLHLLSLNFPQFIPGIEVTGIRIEKQP